MADQDPQTVDVDQLAINTIRFLAVDMVEAAQSGHPGAPLGQAPMAYLLWTRFLRHNPDNPDWPNRDRFVLSCGHASALIYALLHLAGYGLPIEELKRFRQFGSKTPGHPEHELTRGVETTTGPLGQGLGNSVGMAIAECLSRNRFNREGFPLFDYRVWVFASDGDMEEGVTSEACSLAGHLKLGQLKVFYDDNKVSIDGPTSLSFSEDVGKRFEAYGWFVQHVADVDGRLAGKLPDGWQDGIPTFKPGDKPLATRAASGQVLNGIAGKLPMLVGGSADLTPSNNTAIKGRTDFEAANAEGLYLRFGI